jgi:spectinomycin phosphotransferase
VVRPDVRAQQIVDHVRNVYGLDARNVSLIPGRTHAEATVYRIDVDDAAYVLKLSAGPAANSSLVRHLADSGITQVPVPMSPRGGRPSPAVAGLSAVLYPFIEGENGFRRPLNEEQWIALGAVVRAVHDVTLPPSLRTAMRKEAYANTWRRKVRGCLNDVPAQNTADDVARELVGLLSARHDQIAALVEHAELLAGTLSKMALPMVACHGDLHAGNVLVAGAGSVTIVDWDDPVLAPKERDLMFIGAGIGGAWNRPKESDAFYRGYGPAEVHTEALAYYRCERIVQDVASFCDRLLLPSGEQNAEHAHLVQKLADAFAPGDVVEIAERTFATR